MSAMVWTMRDVLARTRRKKPKHPPPRLPWWMHGLEAALFVTALTEALRQHGWFWAGVITLCLTLTGYGIYRGIVWERYLDQDDLDVAPNRTDWALEAFIWALWAISLNPWTAQKPVEAPLFLIALIGLAVSILCLVRAER